MKFGPVAKFDKRNMATLKIFAGDVISINYNVIFLIYGQFGAIGKQDSRCMVCKTCIFINNNADSWEKDVDISKMKWV